MPLHRPDSLFPATDAEGCFFMPRSSPLRPWFVPPSSLVRLKGRRTQGDVGRPMGLFFSSSVEVFL